MKSGVSLTYEEGLEESMQKKKNFTAGKLNYTTYLPAYKDVDAILLI